MSSSFEALGMSLLGSSQMAAPDPEKADSAEESARVLVQAVKNDLKPRDIITRKSIENAVALVMPTIFQLVHGGSLPRVGAESVNFGVDLEHMSFAVAIILLISYIGGLIFSLRTHQHLFNAAHGEDDHVDSAWPVRRSVITLAIAGVAVGVMSEILVGSINDASSSIGLSNFFVGLIVVAIVGNAAEHWVAVYFAMKDKMDLSVSIAIGSSAQIALFVGPVLVLCSFVLGPHPMALVFNGFELGAILLAVIIANHVTNEGESTWFEGLQLLAVYLVFGLAFYVA
jgi:Ca2+:H+ antiporter